MLAPTLESILVDVTNAGHGEAKAGATGAVKEERGFGREGSACLVHEDVDSTPYLLFPVKVVGSAHQEVLPPTQARGRGEGSVRPDLNVQHGPYLTGVIVRSTQPCKWHFWP